MSVNCFNHGPRPIRFHWQPNPFGLGSQAQRPSGDARVGPRGVLAAIWSGVRPGAVRTLRSERISSRQRRRRLALPRRRHCAHKSRTLARPFAACLCACGTVSCARAECGWRQWCYSKRFQAAWRVLVSPLFVPSCRTRESPPLGLTRPIVWALCPQAFVQGTQVEKINFL